MKLIKPIQINYSGPITVGNTKEAMNLLVNITGDNLIDTCYIYFELQDINGIDLYHGNMSISGSDYINWNGDNNYPYNYVAIRYNLTILN